MNQDYVFSVGPADHQRMNLLDSIYQHYSQQFLADNRLNAGMIVADIGCGPGLMSQWIAQQIGNSGKLIGIDSSTEQLILAKQKCAENNLNNCEFIEANIYDLENYQEYFDMIFCRFLFVHLKEPWKALDSLLSALKPGGTLIIAELDNSTWDCSPQYNAFDIQTQLLTLYGKLNYSNFKIGAELHHMLVNRQLKQVEIKVDQPVLKTESDREYIIIKNLALKNSYLQSGMLSEQEFNQMITELRALINDKHYLIKGAQMYQAAGRKK